MDPTEPSAAEDRRPAKLDIGNLAEVAQWLAGFIATAAASGVIGNAAHDTLKSIRRRFGRRRVEELEQQVYRELKRVKRKPHVSDADLRQRAAAIFRDYENL